MPIDGDFNERELYYQIDGGEFRLMPIKPLEIKDIEFVQSNLETSEWLKGVDVDYETMITHCDELFKSIEAIERHYEEQNDLYCICEMAKRYLYLLKKIENEQKTENN